MLDSKLTKKIADFVYIKPRTIQEIAQHVNKNWRTAERYVNKIIEETGSIAVRTFRGGTRGALKIVYWNSIEKIHSSELQKRLFNKIEQGKRRNDFSPFDIYQHVADGKRMVYAEQKEHESATDVKKVISMLRSAQNQVLFFSGNLSFTNFPSEDRKIVDVIEELAKNNISIKILTRVDIAGRRNIEEAAAINERLGKDIIEIRHCEQPLRAIIVDDKIARFKEKLDPGNYAEGELDKKTFLFYEIYDAEWVEWLQKVFWHLFRTAVPLKKRLECLKDIGI